MKMSRRAKRMDRHHKRNKGRAVLNLVSLMDIFTILVFFLLVNSGQVQVLPNAKAIQLPESAAEQRPKETLVLMVNAQEILLKGHQIVDLTVPLPESDTIPALQEQLQAYAAQSMQDDPKAFKGEITIMGDKAVPYALLKRVMATCAQSEYPRVSLAVLQRPAQEQETQAL